MITFPTLFYDATNFDEYDQGQGIQNILGFTMTGATNTPVETATLSLQLTGVTTNTNVYEISFDLQMIRNPSYAMKNTTINSQTVEVPPYVMIQTYDQAGALVDENTNFTFTVLNDTSKNNEISVFYLLFQILLPLLHWILCIRTLVHEAIT